MLALKKKNGTDSSSTTMIVSRRRLKEPTARASADRDFLQELDMIERLAAAKHHATYRIVADHDGQTCFFTQQHVDILQQGASAGQHHALVDDVGCELGWRTFEREQNGLDDGVQWLGQSLTNLV